MKFKKGYKYQLEEFYSVKMDLGRVHSSKYISISPKRLQIHAGYAWDGPSGPVRDTKKTMRASLIHDALYQLLREVILMPSFKDQADQIFKQICIEDGVPRWRAHLYCLALKKFGKPAADPKNRKEIYDW